MPYQAGERLPGERASRLGHLDVLRSELVLRLCESFEAPAAAGEVVAAPWQPFPSRGAPLPLVFGIDGSMQAIQGELPPFKALAFVKTALLRLDQYALAQVDQAIPHPFQLRDILSDSALYHATVFPLRHVSIPGLSTYDAVRQIIYESLKDASLEGEPMETLRWLAYEKWDGQPKSLPPFGCPYCHQMVASLPYNQEQGNCPGCGGAIYLTDMLGFHLEMTDDTAPDSIASAYMTVHETLLLLTGVRYYWENDVRVLSECLFVKDGPLSLRAQYSKLVPPIRRFLAFARDQGHPVHIIGQEKTGTFVEHGSLIGRQAPAGSFFLPGDPYIKREIQNRPDSGTPYGLQTNYGAKVFLKLNDYHLCVLNLPTGEHKPEPKVEDLIGFERIVGTLPLIASSRFEGALLPVELAHGVASLSTYPSAQILKLFATSRGVG